ncbi:symmetrical bis(5'-nucleosyl)-tetraphosphatase [Fontimonas sp. SYSU GA230001]|uniref:symmetrical bis(5'-nucleosyl)-tetraphosphatase n=1 Tax=Fontimonas sp. SYSU GA230001 TaxID=3142450 RepID=UPI0032B50CFC
MATYIVGDIQGCRASLERLLDLCRFDPGRDRLVCTGDLVARGPDSAGVLRLVRSLGASASSVLGNHDLHLLGLAQGIGKPGDGLADVLDAADAGELLAWLAEQPLAWRDPDTATLVVHAGVLPRWSADQTLALAAEAQAVLRDADARRRFLPRMYGNHPAHWDETLTGADRWRVVINALTRLRYCRADGSMDFHHKGAPGTQPAGLLPWFAVPARASRDTTLVFGHWSTLGRIEWPQWGVWGLDTGAVWGGPLTALRLDDRELFQVPGPTVRPARI